MEQEFTPTPNFDSHATALLFGIVIGEFFSYVAFDIRLVKALIKKCCWKPMPIAYLLARYVMTAGVTMIAMSTMWVYHGKKIDVDSVHWARAILMPISFTATSAILGLRVLILHFDRPRLMPIVIHTLLVTQLVTGLVVLCLNKAAAHDKKDNIFMFLPGMWIVVPVGVGMVVDLIFTMFVVVPIARCRDRPKHGQVLHLFMTDAVFYGLLSFLAKGLAIGVTVFTRHHRTDSFIAIRVEIVTCTIFACRIFRGQEMFLKERQDQAAFPKLSQIRIDTPQISQQSQDDSPYQHAARVDDPADLIVSDKDDATKVQTEDVSRGDIAQQDELEQTSKFSRPSTDRTLKGVEESICAKLTSTSSSQITRTPLETSSDRNSTARAPPFCQEVVRTACSSRSPLEENVRQGERRHSCPLSEGGPGRPHTFVHDSADHILPAPNISTGTRREEPEFAGQENEDGELRGRSRNVALRRSTVGSNCFELDTKISCLEASRTPTYLLEAPTNVLDAAHPKMQKDTPESRDSPIGSSGPSHIQDPPP